jgi:hypothetical protein
LPLFEGFGMRTHTHFQKVIGMLAGCCIREIGKPKRKNLRLCQEKPNPTGEKPDS